MEAMRTRYGRTLVERTCLREFGQQNLISGQVDTGNTVMAVETDKVTQLAVYDPARSTVGVFTLEKANILKLKIQANIGNSPQYETPHGDH